MTDANAQADVASDPDESPPDDDATPTDAAGRRDRRTLPTYAGIAALVLLALVAGLQFYLAAGRAIGLWVAPAYEPFVQAAFNLALLLVATAGVLALVRRLDR